MSPLLGILGGMGPAASAEFYTRLVAATPATRDQDHLRVAMWADPTVPDRIEALATGGPEVAEALDRGVSALTSIGATHLVCPCNTAHVWLREVVARHDIELIDIVDEAVAAVRAAGWGRVALLATSGTLDAGLYQRACEREGVLALAPVEQDQRRVAAAIYDVKSGDPARLSAAGATLREVVVGLAQEQGAQVVLGACTEIPLALRGVELPIPVLDSLDTLAAAAVERVRGAR